MVERLMTPSTLNHCMCFTETISGMEDRSGEEKQVTPSQSVIHTYYQGDINTVVDEHFFRALNKSSMPKDLSTRRKPGRGSRPGESVHSVCLHF